MAASDVIVVDRKNKDQKALTGYGSRVERLLVQQSVTTSPHMVAALDDFLGALFALLFARQGGFVDRTSHAVEVAAIVRRAGQLTKGSIKADGPWMAGFHFNSAVFRLAAAYHRVLKVVTGNPDTGERVDALCKPAETLYLKWTGVAWSHDELDKVLGQVNKLKHSPKGVFFKRSVKYPQAMAAANELLTLAEAWANQNCTMPNTACSRRRGV